MTDFKDIDLTNSNYWETEHFSIVNSPLSNNFGFHLPIPDFVIPVMHTRPIMAARCFNPVAPEHWRFGLWLSQSIAAPAQIDAGGKVTVANWRVPLYQPNGFKRQRIFFPDPTPIAWLLTASVPYWHKQIEIAVWSFNGPLPPRVSQQAAFLSSEMAILQNKIDQVLNLL